MSMPYWLRGLFQNEESAVEETGASGGSESEKTYSGIYDLVDPGVEFHEEPKVEPAAPSDEKKSDEDKTATETVAKDSVQEAGKSSAKDEEAADDISDNLIDRAAKLGYTFEDIKDFRSNTSLQRELDRVERMKARFPAVNAEPKQKTEAAESPIVLEFTKQIEEQKALIEQMKTDEYDPKIIQMAENQLRIMQGQHERQIELDRRNAEQEERLEQQQAEMQQRALERETATFESELAGLGKEYEALFGTGPGEKMDRNSQEFANRQKVWQQAQVTIAGLQALGLPVPPKSELYQQAVNAKFGSHVSQLARQKLKSDIKEASSQALTRNRPAGSQSQRGINKAEEAFENYFATHE